jgi:hypothetical protein
LQSAVSRGGPRPPRRSAGEERESSACRRRRPGWDDRRGSGRPRRSRPDCHGGAGVSDSDAFFPRRAGASAARPRGDFPLVPTDRDRALPVSPVRWPKRRRRPWYRIHRRRLRAFGGHLGLDGTWWADWDGWLADRSGPSRQASTSPGDDSARRLSRRRRSVCSPEPGAARGVGGPGPTTRRPRRRPHAPRPRHRPRYARRPPRRPSAPSAAAPLCSVGRGHLVRV